MGVRGGGGVNAIYWHQIIALDSVVVKTQNLFSSHGGFCVITEEQSYQINTL